MRRLRVLLDANVLVDAQVRDLFLRLAEAELIDVRWSAQILAEPRRALVCDTCPILLTRPGRRGRRRGGSGYSVATRSGCSSRSGRHVEADPTRLLRAEVKAILTAAVADLPKRQRQVISALFMAEDRDHQCYAAVAERFQVPIGSLGPTRQRALLRLRHGHAVAVLVA